MQTKCLDHGFVELVDAMGNDQTIVRSARVSYGNDLETQSLKADRALIRYLMRHRHTTPLECVVLVFHIKMPIFVARQMVRHRMSSINEISARYTELPEEFYVPEPEHICYQATDNKQGRSGVMEHGEQEASMLEVEASTTFKLYQGRLKAGMAKELARINLPLSAYTRWYQKFDLHNLFHFLSLRLDRHAQYETRVYAEAMASFVKERVPLAWEAFEDFRLNAVTFSAAELRALARTFRVDSSGAAMEADNSTWPTDRERTEYLEKIAMIEKLAP